MQQQSIFWELWLTSLKDNCFFSYRQASVNQQQPQAQSSDEPLAAKRPRLPTPPPTLAIEPSALPPELVTAFLPASITPNTSTAPCLPPATLPVSAPTLPAPEPSESYTHSSSYIAYMESLLNTDFPPDEGEQGVEPMYWSAALR